MPTLYLGTSERRRFEKVIGEVGWQAAVKARDGAPGQGAASRAPYSESRADVGAQHLCSPSGTGRSADDGGCVGSMESRRQQDETVGGGFGGVGAASCFPGSELQVESRADVAWADATISDGEGGGLRGSARQQDEVVAKEGLQVAAESRDAAPDHGAAPWMLGPESWADVVSMWCQPDATVGDGDSGGLMRRARQQGEVACGDDNGRLFLVVLSSLA